MVRQRVGRYSQIARILNLLNLLQSRKEGFTVSQLYDRICESYPIARRSLYRDLEALEAAGFPIVSSRAGEDVRWKLGTKKFLPQIHDLPRGERLSSVELSVSTKAFPEVKTSLLSHSGKFLAEEAGWIRVTVSIQVSEDLTRWLMSLGPLVRVEKPETLARQIAEKAAAVVETYKQCE